MRLVSPTIDGDQIICVIRIMRTILFFSLLQSQPLSASHYQFSRSPALSTEFSDRSQLIDNKRGGSVFRPLRRSELERQSGDSGIIKRYRPAEKRPQGEVIPPYQYLAPPPVYLTPYPPTPFPWMPFPGFSTPVW